MNLGPGIWNESANESGSDTKEGGQEEEEVDEIESNLDDDELRTERAVGPEFKIGR